MYKLYKRVMRAKGSLMFKVAFSPNNCLGSGRGPSCSKLHLLPTTAWALGCSKQLRCQFYLIRTPPNPSNGATGNFHIIRPEIRFMVCVIVPDRFLRISSSCFGCLVEPRNG